MKSLSNMEMVEAFIKAEQEDMIEKRFAIVGFANQNYGTTVRRCEIVSYNGQEAVIKEHGNCPTKLFKKSYVDNRFYAEYDSRKWVICLSLVEANEIAKDHSATNQYLSTLSDKMKFLTEEELQPIAMYIEGCMERRF